MIMWVSFYSCIGYDIDNGKKNAWNMSFYKNDLDLSEGCLLDLSNSSKGIRISRREFNFIRNMEFETIRLQYFIRKERGNLTASHGKLIKEQYLALIRNFIDDKSNEYRIKESNLKDEKEEITEPNLMKLEKIDKKQPIINTEIIKEEPKPRKVSKPKEKPKPIKKKPKPKKVSKPKEESKPMKPELNEPTQEKVENNVCDHCSKKAIMRIQIENELVPFCSEDGEIYLSLLDDGEKENIEILELPNEDIKTIKSEVGIEEL